MSRQAAILPVPSAPAKAPVQSAAPAAPSSSVRNLIVNSVLVQAAAAVAYAVHALVPNGNPAQNTHAYPLVLLAFFIFASLAALIQAFWPPMRRWLAGNAPLMSAALLIV